MKVCAHPNSVARSPPTFYPCSKNEPWKSFKDRINIWIVATPSEESGINILKHNIAKKTVFGATRGCDSIPRILEEAKVLEVANQTPFDARFGFGQ